MYKQRALAIMWTGNIFGLEISSKSFHKLQEARANIYKVLAKKDELLSWPEWESFFRGIPSSNEVEHASYINALMFLFFLVSAVIL